LQKKVRFLGHVVGPDGIETDPEKCTKVKEFPRPTNPDQLRSIVHLAGYYRKFIPNFSKVARPLTDLLPPTAVKKGKKPVKFTWKWEQIHEDTFNKIKELLTSSPILGYPIFGQPFELHCDASLLELGTVLYQKQEGMDRVIAYASRTLSKPEKNYSVFKLKFLA